MGTSRLFFLLALGPVVLAQAQVAEGPKPEATVSVTAEAVPVAVTQTPNPVRLIDRDELERLQVHTVADLIQAVLPGAVMGAGGTGAQTSAFLNGTLSRNVVILLDGVRLNDPTDVSPNLGGLGLVGIEQVEVLLGPTSVLYGSDAIGGVIALRSASSVQAGFHGRTVLMGGTSGQAAAGGAVSLSGTAGWVSAGAEASRQGSEFASLDFHQAGGFLRMGGRLGGVDLTLHYRNSGQTASLPFDVQYLPPTYDPVRVYVADREGHARQESWGLQARWQASPAFLAEEVLTVMEGATGDPAGNGRVQKDRRYRRVEEALSLHWTPTQAFRLSGRLEGREDRSRATNYYDPLTFGTVRYEGEARDLAAALEARWELTSGLALVGGLRRDWTHRDLTRSATDLRVRAGEAEAGTGKVGLNWEVSRNWRVYAAYGQGFRMPNLIEFMLNAQASQADATAYPIAPERSRTVQVGVSGSLGHGLTFRAEAQRTQVTDLLAYRYDGTFSGAFTDHYENAGRIRAQSLEGALGWRGGGAMVWGWDVSLRTAETRDLDHDTPDSRFGSTSNTAIVRHPFFTASLATFAARGPWRGDLRFDHIGPRYDVQDVPYFNVVPNHHPYRELTASLAWSGWQGLSVSLKAEHLLQPRQSEADWRNGRYDGDGDAQLVLGYPAPSRRVSLTAAYRW